MSLFNYRYNLYPNGDIVVIKEVNREHRNLLTEKDRKKPRNFNLNYSAYRKISSGAIELIKMAKNKVIFLTFTFNEKLKLTESDGNKIWNTFIKNFRKTYKCENYVGVLEFTQKGAPHYHFLCDYPFRDIRDISNSWTNCISNYIGGFNHPFKLGSVRLPKNHSSIVEDPDSCVRYICKYLSKARERNYATKCYFISRELRKRTKPRELTVAQMHFINDNIECLKDYKFEFSQVKCYNWKDIDDLVQHL